MPSKQFFKLCVCIKHILKTITLENEKIRQKKKEKIDAEKETKRKKRKREKSKISSLPDLQ